MKNSTVDFINEKLKIHGKNQYGQPNFRVVFSDEQTEKRKGIFLGIEVIQEVQKYPWIQEKWILERWAPGELAYHKDLESDKDGVYICVYTFQDKQRNYLPPLLKVAEIIVSHLLHPRSKSEALAEDRIIESKEDEVEIEENYQQLMIQHDEATTKDPKSHPETASVGYVKEKI